MSYTVTGRIGAVAYTAVVGDTGDHPDAAGIVTGSPNVLDLLRQNAGATHGASPVGPFAPLDLDDPVAVLIALQDLTTVQTVQGEVPELSEDDAPPGAVF